MKTKSDVTTSKPRYRAVNLEEDCRVEFFPKFFVLSLQEEEKKRTLCPFKMEKELQVNIKRTPKSIGSNGRNSFIKVASKEQSEHLAGITSILGEECTVVEHSFYNGTKAVIHLRNNVIGDLESFRNGLKRVYNIRDIKPATWIRPRNENNVAYVVTFGTEILPEYIKITGEHILTRVYPYKDKPLHCTNCQKYGHQYSRCHSPARCGVCAGGHHTRDCTSDEVTYANCEEGHRAGNSNCEVRKKE